MTKTDASAAPDGLLRPVRWAPAAAGLSIVVLFLALLFGGSATGTDLPGLADPGPVTRWGLPLARAILDGAAAVTIGLVGLALVLPTQEDKLSRDALRALRAATWAALVLAVAAAVTHLLTLSDLIGEPLLDALAGSAFASYTSDVAQGRAYAAVVVLALSIIPATRLTLSRGGVLATLCVAIGALLPLALVGHSSGGDYHHSASISLLAHLVGLTVWVGGLVALSWYASTRGRALRSVAQTYSTVALGCFVLVGSSGLVNAMVRLTSIGDLFTTSYGVLLLVKTAAYAALCVFGVAHRRRTIPQLEPRRPRAFLKLAVGEIAVMGTAIAVGIAMSRTAPPRTDRPVMTPARDLLGFPPPGPIDAGQLFLTFYPDALFFIGCIVATLLYLAGVNQLRKRGDTWPVGRTIAFLMGIATIALVQLTGVMTYSMTLMSVHMLQHMTLMMISPALIVLGAPVLLALRAIRPAPRGHRGPREWLLIAIHSRVARFFVHPLIALPLFVSGVFIIYFTPLFEWAMVNHAGHLLMSVHFLITGVIYYEMLIGIDPLPKRPPYALRLVIQLLAASLHAVFGLALMQYSRIIAADYYRVLREEMSWLPDMAADQELAGQITWGVGEIPALAAVMVLVFQWIRTDSREAKRFDRSEGETEKQRTAYNAYLASLAERDHQNRG